MSIRSMVTCSVVLTAFTACHQALAQAYPVKPIRLIVPLAAGGGLDITARTIGVKLTEAWGQPVVADNRPGANGTIALDIAAKSPPDGYTLTMISTSNSMNVSLYNLPYDLIRDLAPITQATSQPWALVVHPAVAAKSVKELIALARARPGAINYGSSGNGGAPHLASALFASLADINITHVPYKGGGPAMNDVIAGQIQMVFSTLLIAHPHIKSGRLRALAVTSAKRSSAAPELATMQEAGVPGYDVSGWYGVLAPARTPPAIITRLNKEIVRILNTPEARERFAAEGSDPVGSTPEQFAAHIKSEVAKWRGVITAANIKVN